MLAGNSVSGPGALFQTQAYIICWESLRLQRIYHQGFPAR